MSTDTPRVSAPPVALTIAGSDSSAGAGLQADLKAFASHGVYGLNAVTAVVAEAPGEVAQILNVPPAMLLEQLRSITASFPVKHAKTGMLANGENVNAVCHFLDQHPEISLIVDPVMLASSGDALLTPDGIEAVKSLLLPRATLATPNLREAAYLLGQTHIDNEAVPEAARELSQRYQCHFLVKGGHGSDPSSICDHAWIAGEALEFRHARLDVSDTHGTGCTLSAAITARLAHGEPLETAVRQGIEYVVETLRSRLVWHLPSSHDPAASRTTAALNHFPAVLN